MPDFNKGDFTQQGVAGHVNANLRLNEKRLVNIDLTSNEEAEGCTITGTVKDLLNDKVYGIGSGASGNIEITENGENINVAQYATATVNVAGGGGMPYFTTTIINDSGYLMSEMSFSMLKKEYGVGPLKQPIPVDSTAIMEYLYSEGVTGFYYLQLEFENLQVGPANITYSELVNCTYDNENQRLVITDITKNASATLILTVMQ